MREREERRKESRDEEGRKTEMKRGGRGGTMCGEEEKKVWCWVGLGWVE